MNLRVSSAGVAPKLLRVHPKGSYGVLCLHFVPGEFELDACLKVLGCFRACQEAMRHFPTWRCFLQVGLGIRVSGFLSPLLGSGRLGTQRDAPL